MFSSEKTETYSNVFSDFHGAWQNRTGLNAPLYRRLGELESDEMLNQVKQLNYPITNRIHRSFFSSLKDFGINIWLNNGAPPHKLVLGLPLFARSFLLAQSHMNELNSPTIGNGTEGPFTHSAGFLSYFEVKIFLRRH